MLTAEVARNLVVLLETVDDDLFLTVFDSVSAEFAVKYVEKYSEKMRRNGRDAMKACGRLKAGTMAFLR